MTTQLSPAAGPHSPSAAAPHDPSAASPHSPRRISYPWHLRLAWLLALVGGVVAYVTTFAIMLLTSNPTMLPTVLLVGAAVIPLTVLLLAQSTAAGPLAPGRIVLVTAAAGGLFGICAAGLEESLAGVALGRASILLVGVIEETAKLVVPLIVLALAHRVTRGGGIVIGIASATGFAVLETMGYGFDALLARNGGLGALDATLVLRGILVPAGHVAWTGAVCAALWYLVETSHSGRGALALGAAYVGAIVMHTAWDATSGVVLHVGIGVVSVAVLLWLILAAHRAHVRRPAPSAAGPRLGSAPLARTA
ncbi:PrsW family intramembrane metalloprotease [Brachybacterium saurashtrense]|nr:PrsW family intramembrane metalloprotease [Brachybacterium saurashtrense]